MRTCVYTRGMEALVEVINEQWAVVMTAPPRSLPLWR